MFSTPASHTRFALVSRVGILFFAKGHFGIYKVFRGTYNIINLKKKLAIFVQDVCNMHTDYLALQYGQTGGGQPTSVCVCPFMYSCVSSLPFYRHVLLFRQNLPYYYDSRNINFMFLSKILVDVLRKSVASLITL